MNGLSSPTKQTHRAFRDAKTIIEISPKEKMFPLLPKGGEVLPEVSLVFQVGIRDIPSDGQYSVKITTASDDRSVRLKMGDHLVFEAAPLGSDPRECEDFEMVIERRCFLMERSRNVTDSQCPLISLTVCLEGVAGQGRAKRERSQSTEKDRTPSVSEHYHHV
jgi:hypothetical protein